MQGESPRMKGESIPCYLDEENKYFIPEELLKYHTEVIGSSGMGKTNIFNHLIEQAIRNGIGMFVFDAKSNYNKHIPYYAHKYGRLHDLKYFDLADVKRSQTYNPDFKDKPDEVFNGLMKSHFLRAGDPGILPGPSQRRFEQPNQPSFHGVQARHPDGLPEPHFQRNQVL